jgi:hypothetical protein
MAADVADGLTWYLELLAGSIVIYMFIVLAVLFLMYYYGTKSDNIYKRNVGYLSRKKRAYFRF